jgi:phosphoadenosine phosphosulfate reductase
LSSVTQYLEKNQIPQNSLHQKGYVSIGCAPCTRAINKGDDIRSGRWWWEESKKECGLHLNQKS